MKSDSPDIRSRCESDTTSASNSIFQTDFRIHIPGNDNNGSRELFNQEIFQEYFSRGKNYKGDNIREQKNQDQFIEEKSILTSSQTLYNDTISSSKNLPMQKRSANSISEMLIEKELNIYGITDNNYNKTSNGYIPDFYKHRQPSPNEDYQSLKCPSEENLFLPDHFYDTIRITSNQSNNIKPHHLGSDLSLDSLKMNGSSDGTLDSEDDSNTSSEFSSIEEMLFKEGHLTTNLNMPVSSELGKKKQVTVTDCIEDLDEIDRQLAMIDKEIKTFSQTTKFDVPSLSVGLEMENQMAEKFENLQRDISRFLERTAIFENMGNDLLKFDSDQNEPEQFKSSPQQPNQIENFPNPLPSTNENSNHMLDFPSPNRKTLPNELLAHSLDLFPSFDDNPDLKNSPVNHNGTEQKSDFLNEVKDSAITVNEEATKQENLMLNKDVQDFSEIFNQGSPTKSVETLYNFEGKETIIRRDNIEDELFLTSKHQSNEESTELECYKRCLDLNVDKKANQFRKKNYFSDYNNKTSRDFILGKRNMQEGIKFFEDEVTDKKNDLIKSRGEVL